MATQAVQPTNLLSIKVGINLVHSNIGKNTPPTFTNFTFGSDTPRARDNCLYHDPPRYEQNYSFDHAQLSNMFRAYGRNFVVHYNDCHQFCQLYADCKFNKNDNDMLIIGTFSK